MLRPPNPGEDPALNHPPAPQHLALHQDARLCVQFLRSSCSPLYPINCLLYLAVRTVRTEGQTNTNDKSEIFSIGALDQMKYIYIYGNPISQLLPCYIDNNLIKSVERSVVVTMETRLEILWFQIVTFKFFKIFI